MRALQRSRPLAIRAVTSKSRSRADRVKAAVFNGPRDVRIENVPEPAPPDRGEVLLEVVRAAICGTDAAEWDHGPILCRPGVVLGHEFVGRVVAAGDDVTERQGRRPRGLRGRDLVRPLSMVPRWPHEPVLRVSDARSPGGRRSCGARCLARRYLSPRPRPMRRRRGGYGPTTRGRPTCLVESGARPSRAIGRDRCGRYWLFPRRRRLESQSRRKCRRR